MVNIFARNKGMKFVIMFMCLALLVSPFLDTTTAYGNEAALPAVNEAARAVTDAVYEAAPPVPQNLTVVTDSITATSAQLKWDVHPEQADVDVWYYVAPDPANPTKEDINNYLATGKGGSVELQNLQPNTTYKLYTTWYKRPYTRVLRSNYVEFTTLAGEPSNEPTGNPGPSNLSIVNVTHNTVTVTFDPAHKLDDYWVWNPDNPPLNKDPYSGFTQVGGNTIGGLKEETKYTFFLGPNGTQYANLTDKQKSNSITFTTPKDTSEYKEPPLTPPQYLKVSDITSSNITFKWSGSPDANGYDFYVNGGWKGGIWNGSDTFIYTFPEGGLTAGSIYKFMVGAQNGASGKDPVNGPPLEIKWGELAVPLDLQVITANRTTASLGWAPTPGATSYDIYEAGKLIGSSDSNRYVAEGLTEGKSYSFTVAAKNALWKSAASSAATTIPGADYTNFTYYGSWFSYDNNRQYFPEDIDVSQLTHLNYAFSDICWRKVGSNGVACQNKDIPLQANYVFDGELVLGDQKVDIEQLAVFNKIKNNNPELKLMASVGGWTFSNHFSDMAASEVTRRTFANSVVKYLRTYKMDGLDIDWEYPVEGGESDNINRPEDKQNFTLLMQTVRAALDAAGSIDGKYYLLTIASGQGDDFVVNADFANSVQYLDMINIMSYDYSGSWELRAFHNSPLYQDPNNVRASAKRNNVRGALLGHLNGGVPAFKLNMGVPYYGIGWKGCSANGEYQNCTSIPYGSWESGKFDFAEVENNMIDQNGYTRYWNEHSKVAYVYNSETGMFITYNDQTTMMYSTSLVKTLDLAGVMTWDISGDRNKTLTTQLISDLPIDGKVNENALAAPQNVTKLSADKQSFEIKWDAVQGAAGYEVFVNAIFTGYTVNTQFKADKLNLGSDYTVTVLSIRKDGNNITEVSPASSALVVSTAGVISPAHLTVTSSTYDAISVQWTASPKAAGYDVYLGDKLVESTTATNYTFTQLTHSTTYFIGVVAITKNEDEIIEKSEMTKLEAKTLDYTAPPESSSGNPQAVKDKNELDSNVTKSGGKWTVTILKDAAIQTIGAASSAELKVTVGNDAAQVDVILPKEVIAALASKNDKANLSIIWNGVTYVIPAHAIHLKSDIKISITPPTASEAAAIEQLAKKNGYTLKVSSLDFKIYKLTADNKYEEVTDFGKSVFTSIYQLNAKDIDTNRANGVVYLPGTNEFRPLHTVFKKDDKGGFTAHLVSNGNSIYTIVESSFVFKDVTAEWNKNYIERAAAKLIVFGQSNEQFGGNTIITRAEFISMISRGLGIVPKVEGAPFDDVAADSKYAGDIALAKELGIITGKSEQLFDPNGTITRQDMAVILAKVMKLIDRTADGDAALLESFRDQASISSYAKASVALLVKEQILQGVSETKFDPQAKVTKAQAVVAVMRLLDNLGLASK
ncbi:glycosyl hydrolase family 18 protein [Paenibacillus sp. NRS-1760]|uniref:glycosyl hydrolase family 18 protein n=1 Tax=Paenibacillus sp. NRS-1760 TaxID=3233902 RepID=UPI003D2DB525